MRPASGARGRSRLPRFVTGVPFLVTAGVLAVLALAYTLAGFFLVPRLITTHVPRYVQEQLQRRAQLGEVRVNPLLFKLEIKDFRLQEADGRPLLGFDRLFVDFELSSLFHWAWTFAEITLEGPRLDVALSRDGRLNLVVLVDSLPRGEPPAEPQPAPATPRVLLLHAVVRGGVVSFTDLSGRNPVTAALEPIDVELRNITTIPERRGPYAIAATLAGGGVIGWEGEVSLVPLGSTGRFGILDFPLATAWRFVQDDIALAEPAGRVDADLRYRFAYRDGTTSASVEGLDITVAGLVLMVRGETAPLLTLEHVRVAGGHGDLAAREVTVPEISVSRGRVAATMARDGTLNWQRLTTPADGIAPAPPAAAPAPAGDAPPWRLAVEEVHVDEIALAFVDASRATPVAIDVADLTLDLSARIESGSAGLSGGVEGLALKLARVAMREAAPGKAPLITLDEITVDGGRVDLEAQQVAVSRVGVTGGATTVVRAPDGSLPLVTMLGPAAEAPRAPAPPPSARRAAAPAARPWTVALDRRRRRPSRCDRRSLGHAVGRAGDRGHQGQRPGCAHRR